jgi:type I restriction enzyme S subunit
MNVLTPNQVIASRNQKNGGKPGWRRVKFGDVLECVNDTVTDPQAAGAERVVGLDHLDPGSLHIKRWANVEDGTTFTRRFKSGQVLFGKRRAYQRKLAVADFDGICSGDILVFEPKNDDLLPELLPFIMQAEGFWQHALDTSAGSLSPRTKWQDLARYEFALPPKDEQRRIAEILWAADQARCRWEEGSAALGDAKQALLRSLSAAESSVTEVALGEVIEHPQYGLSIPLHTKGRYPIFRMMNFDDGRIVANDMKYVDLSEPDFAAYKLYPGDLLFNRTNSADLVGKVGIFELEGDYVFASYLVRLRCKPAIVIPQFLNYYLNSDEGQRRIIAFATPGVSQTNINATNLKRVRVPLPSIEAQTRLASRLAELDKNGQAMRTHIAEVHELQSALRKQLLESD